ncbi:hypothetical protein ACLI1A_09705 [Flavobacterium sp. RHBU_3]|uniref:hypothetical protein n=1 Tax=Flavobacterium sp. RHBU_3 TaxID=3391184 RepID=UPI003984B17C
MKKVIVLLVVSAFVSVSCSTEETAISTNKTLIVPKLPTSHYVNMWKGFDKKNK